jgi:TonB family protein
MSDKLTEKTSAVSWVLIALMVIGVGASVYVVKGVLSDDGPRRKSSTTTVTLLKPPPPPQIKEKPPEPEPAKQMQKQEVVADLPQNVTQDKPAGEPDNAPAGSNLGVDAEGGAGGDAFGLVGNKGGRGILAGGGGSGGGGSLSLLTKYSGYVQTVQAEIQKKVMQRMDEQGWFPKGKLQASIRIVVDSSGKVTEYKLIGSSGSHKMDDTVLVTLSNYKFREPPPNGKVSSMVIRISSQG